MNFDADLRLVAETILSRPTAPYHEGQTRAAVEGLISDLPNVAWRRDRFGNVLAHYRHRPRKGGAFGLVAHLDHPGFVVRSGQGRRQVHFLGGVKESYFKGARVVFFEENNPAPVGRGTVIGTDWSGKANKIHLDAEAPDAAFGMWDLPAFRFGSGRLQSRACDDLVGSATLAALLRRLSRSRAKAEVFALFTRAEEVGFHGALASLTEKTRLPRLPVLSIETSNARGFAQFGGGPILRVGDRASIFNPAVSGWLLEAFQAVGEGGKEAIPFQRLLMGGGTCEGTVFQQAGYPTGALCLALNNYHNMGANGRIAAESVSLDDWQGLFDLLFFLAVGAKPYSDSSLPGLSPRLKELQREALANLRFLP